MSNHLPHGSENPRWTCCRIALGRDICALDFILWMSGKWEMFADEKGIPHASGNWRADDVFCTRGEEVHAEFDAWLRERVEAGEFRHA